jgi:hypothetical protein
VYVPSLFAFFLLSSPFSTISTEAPSNHAHVFFIVLDLQPLSFSHAKIRFYRHGHGLSHTLHWHSIHTSLIAGALTGEEKIILPSLYLLGSI